jgi:hypothetical protein
MAFRPIYEKLKLTKHDGLNYMKTYDGKDVKTKRLLFLEQENGNMLALGRVSDVLERAEGTDRLFDMNNNDLGVVTDNDIYNKLFIMIPPPQSGLRAGPPNAGRRRSKKYRAKRPHRKYRYSKKR